MDKIENSAWRGFKGQKWKDEIDVSDFILANYHEYKGDDSFLAGISPKTAKVWARCEELLRQEAKKGLLDVETKAISGINTFKPGYIDRKNEVVFGLQTDKPLKRIVNLYGGSRMAEKALAAYNRKLDKKIEGHFVEYRKTHNDGVFDAYTSEIRKARSAGLITGLPDAYGRGRIIGDYRRVALYGIDAKEAFQWLYFAYLAAVKENNGAAMSLGRTSTFLDIFVERDLKDGVLSEEEAQELVDQFIIKLRLVRHLRTPEYDEIYAGDPTWVTESVAGMVDDKKSLVTKNSFRYLHSLIQFMAMIMLLHVVFQL